MTIILIATAAFFFISMMIKEAAGERTAEAAAIARTMRDAEKRNIRRLSEERQKNLELAKAASPDDAGVFAEKIVDIEDEIASSVERFNQKELTVEQLDAIHQEVANKYRDHANKGKTALTKIITARAVKTAYKASGGATAYKHKDLGDLMLEEGDIMLDHSNNLLDVRNESRDKADVLAEIYEPALKRQRALKVLESLHEDDQPNIG